jgi:hypothetical protein
MTRYLIILTLFSVLTACANTTGKPLPLVDKSDPTWALTPDRLEFGSLPK